jgi:hypothetical protein
MDFLLLLPQLARVALEIDGVQHYAADGAPSPRRHAEMVSEDRALRLARYEVCRFGGQELAGGKVGAAGMLNSFFNRLLALHPAA